MHEEDLKTAKQAEEILEKELKAELKKVVDAGQFAPGQTKTLMDGVCLMLKMTEYVEYLEGKMRGNSFRQMHNPHNGQFMMGGMPYFNPSYAYGYSGHSTRDRMISCLEDLMGEAKNEYEAGMIRDAIAYIQNSK